MRLTLVIAAILVLGLIHTASATTYINHSTTITKPGVYVLTTNLTGNGRGVGIAIYANNVTLIGNGHTITGFDRGIFVKGNNVTVENCVFKGEYLCSIVVLGSDSKVVDCRVDETGGEWAVYIKGSNTKIVNCTVSDSQGDGIHVEGNKNRIVNCTVGMCEWGCAFQYMVIITL